VNNELILQPLAVFFLLVLTVSVRMAFLRVRDFAAKRLSPQAYELRSDRIKLSAAGERTSDHYQNLFEMPVVFIAACMIIYMTGRTDIFYVAAAWAYIALRLVHGFVHLTYNRVYHRFLVFVAGFTVLAALALRLAYQLLFQEP